MTPIATHHLRTTLNLPNRQRKTGPRPLPRLALHADPAALGLHQVPGVGQAQDTRASWGLPVLSSGENSLTWDALHAIVVLPLALWRWQRDEIQDFLSV